MPAEQMVQTYYDPLMAGTDDLEGLTLTFQIALARMCLQHSLSVALTCAVLSCYPAHLWMRRYKGVIVRLVVVGST